MSTKIFKETGKGFVQPKITPPKTGNKIAEPFVAEFMGQDRCDKYLIRQVRVLFIVQQICFPVNVQLNMY